jgi:hypothetical protein
MKIKTYNEFLSNLWGAGSKHDGFNCYCYEKDKLAKASFRFELPTKGLTIVGKVQNFVFSLADLTLKIFLDIDSRCSDGYSIEWVEIVVDKESRFHNIFEIFLFVVEDGQIVKYNKGGFEIVIY